MMLRVRFNPVRARFCEHGTGAGERARTKGALVGC